MEIKIPAHAEKIIRKLNESGHEAYVVGGCVRDMLLGREPEDWDITTSALPLQIKQVFRRTIDTGIQHGTVTVMVDKEGYEVTTYRIDGAYTDGRHPDQVEFTSSLAEDLKRRDFTINAMAYNSRTGFVDEFGGVKDLKQGIIRCVGEPMDRFTEDALRILRAIRFSAQLGFSIEQRTFDAIKVIAPNMVHVSKERIQVELTKLLLSCHPNHISMVYETGISPYVSDEFHRAYGGDEKGIPLIPVLVKPERHTRWAAFLRKCTPRQAVCIMKDLKMDNQTINRVSTLVTWQDVSIEPDKHCIRVMMSRMEPELFDDLLEFKICLAKWTGEEAPSCPALPSCGIPQHCAALPFRCLTPSCGTMEPRPETIEELRHIQKLTEEIRASGDCISLKTLAVTGNDVMAAGVKPGKEVGETLKRLLELVLKSPESNTKEYLLLHLRE